MNDRRYGGPAWAVDTERRPLRPIGTSVYEVARRTGELLSGLVRLPGVRLYEGVQLAGHPPLPYAVIAGSRVVLVDAVAWPPGSYATSAEGAVFCGKIYIGQSAGPLLRVVRRLRRRQRRGQVCAVVVVHQSIAGPLDLPVADGGEIGFVRAEDALAAVHRRLRARPSCRVPLPGPGALGAADGADRHRATS